MGANASSLSELSDNEYLKRLVGAESISPNDPFWNQLLSFSFNPPKTSADHRLLEESSVTLCRTFAQSSIKTGNFAALVHVFLSRATELQASTESKNNVFVWQTYNALFLIRCVLKYFVESMSEESLFKHFKSTWEETSSSSYTEVDSSMPASCSLLERFIDSLFDTIIDVPKLSFTYIIHYEAVNTLIVLLSVQIFMQRPASQSLAFQYVMKHKRAVPFMEILLHNYLLQEKCPSYLERSTPGGSIVLGLAAGIWSMLTFSRHREVEETETTEACNQLLSNQSLLLILILTNHVTHDKHLHNSYRQALFNCNNSTETDVVPDPASFSLDFSQFYETLCHTLYADETTLLLYLLLHQNNAIKNFILARADIERLVIPVLRVLYTAHERNSHHIYMALIILLILSEDEMFSKAVHDVKLKHARWYTERFLSDISLGGILVLVVIRTIQYNMTRMRDKYLHTNCLAALANMSAYFRDLHPYVAQRIVSLFEMLCRKHARIVDQMRNGVPEESSNGDSEETDSTADQVYDLSILEEVIRMVLEIINSSLTNNLRDNPNLVYTLLYRRELFEQFRTHPTFQDILQNIDTVLAYFSNKLEAENPHDTQLSPEHVLEILTLAAKQWPTSRLRKFPEMKFKYVEEDQPEEFFIPYVWSLVYHSSRMYWKATTTHLFSAASL